MRTGTSLLGNLCFDLEAVQCKAVAENSNTHLKRCTYPAGKIDERSLGAGKTLSNESEPNVPQTSQKETHRRNEKQL